MTSSLIAADVVHIAEVLPSLPSQTDALPAVVVVALPFNATPVPDSLRPAKRARILLDAPLPLVANPAPPAAKLAYFGALRNRRTGRTVLHPAPLLLRARPRNAHPARVDPPAAPPPESALHRQEALLTSFGARRDLRRLQNFQRDRITDDSVPTRVARHVITAAAEMRARDAELGISHRPTATTESMAPPHCADADAPEHAYPLHGLLHPAELASATRDADDLIAAALAHPPGPANPGYHHLVWSAISEVLAHPKQGLLEERQRKITAAIHLHHLIVIANIPQFIRPSAYPELMDQMHVDEDVLQSILERYTTPDSFPPNRCKVKSDNDRILSYAVLMWITALGFRNCGQLVLLSEALSADFNFLAKGATYLGCKLRKPKSQQGKNTYTLSLKTPLVFPSMRKRYVRQQNQDGTISFF